MKSSSDEASASAGKEEEAKKEKAEKKKEDEKREEERKEKDEVTELKTKLAYLYAEFDNYRKNAEKEKEFIRSAAAERVVSELLPVIDDLERVLENKKESENGEIIRGVEMIYKNLMKALEKEGLKKIEAKGKKLDPSYHEVLLTCNDEAYEDDAVIEELQKGYMLNSKVIRTAKVKVNKKEGKKSE